MLNRAVGIFRERCIDDKSCHVWRPLSPRRKRVLQLLGKGLTDRKVAEQMDITLGTLRNYLAQLRVHLRVSSLEDVRRLARDWAAGNIRICAEVKRNRS